MGYILGPSLYPETFYEPVKILLCKNVFDRFNVNVGLKFEDYPYYEQFAIWGHGAAAR